MSSKIIFYDRHSRQLDLNALRKSEFKEPTEYNITFTEWIVEGKYCMLEFKNRTNYRQNESDVALIKWFNANDIVGIDDDGKKYYLTDVKEREKTTGAYLTKLLDPQFMKITHEWEVLQRQMDGFISNLQTASPEMKTTILGQLAAFKEVLEYNVQQIKNQ